MKFNPEKHVIGVLCKRGHEWEKSGGSLRNKKSRNCLKCSNTRSRSPANKRADVAYRKRHYGRTLKASKKSWGKSRDSINDAYVKNILKKEYGIGPKDATPEMITIKRELIQFFRLKRGVLNGLTGTRNKRTPVVNQAV